MGASTKGFRSTPQRSTHDPRDMQQEELAPDTRPHPEERAPWDGERGAPVRDSGRLLRAVAMHACTRDVGDGIPYGCIRL